jgi:hypothetical protein
MHENVSMYIYRHWYSGLSANCIPINLCLRGSINGASSFRVGFFIMMMNFHKFPCWSEIIQTGMIGLTEAGNATVKRIIPINICLRLPQ